MKADEVYQTACANMYKSAMRYHHGQQSDTAGLSDRKKLSLTKRNTVFHTFQN